MGTLWCKYNAYISVLPQQQKQQNEKKRSKRKRASKMITTKEMRTEVPYCHILYVNYFNILVFELSSNPLINTLNQY